MTRDSLIWSVTFVSAICSFVASSSGLLHTAFPAIGVTADARIAFIAAIAGFVSGYLKMSPLALSPDHRFATSEASTVLSPTNSSKAIGAVLLACALSVAASGCASMPLKEQAVIGLQASEAALEAGHDAERLLCSPTSDQTQPIRKCDGTAAAAIGLTEAKHQEIARLFSRAFDVELKAALALKVWRAGDPPPQSVADYQRDLTDLLAVIVQTIPRSAPVVAKVQDAVDEAAKVAALAGVK